MKRSSIVALCVMAAVVIYLATAYIGLRSVSKPDLTQADAVNLLNSIGTAFDSKSVDGVLSFAAPDAKVAGKELTEIHSLLHQGFGAMKSPHVEFSNVEFLKRDERTAVLHFDAQVHDRDQGGYAGGGPAYSGRMGFVVKRLEIPRFGGFFTSYEWKVSDVDAPNLPRPENM